MKARFAISRSLLILVFVTAALAQTPEPPLSDSRLSVHTLVREDIFAGFLANDMERFARGEKNIQSLIESRPNAKAELLAWKGGATLYRAVLAHEEKRQAEFEKNYRAALDIFAQARELSPQNPGLHATMGGTYVFFADRLPQENRAAAWSQAYESYQLLWKSQGPVVDKLPVHLRGELLGGLAQSAHRTGHTAEAAQHVEKILAVLADTPYESVAKQWKKNPDAAANDSITCMTCHDSGRLANRVALLNK